MSELLARLTGAAKWPDGGGPGGFAKLTVQDIAGACKGMTRHVYLYALVKFVFDGGSVNELYSLNRQAALYRAKVKRWALDATVVRRMADLSLRDSLVPRLCNHCDGAGIHNNQKECKHCRGSGTGGELSAETKAKFAKVAHEYWNHHCEHRYDEMRREFDVFDSVIAANLRKNLKEVS